MLSLAITITMKQRAQSKKPGKLIKDDGIKLSNHKNPTVTQKGAGIEEFSTLRNILLVR